MICQMVQIDVLKRDGHFNRKSTQTHLDPASMIHKLIKNPGVSGARNFFSSADFINFTEQSSAYEFLNNYGDSSMVMASKIFSDESYFFPNEKTSNVIPDIVNDESKCSEFIKTTLNTSKFGEEQDTSSTPKNNEETINIIGKNQISAEKFITEVAELRETNDQMGISTQNDKSPESPTCLPKTDVSTSIFHIKNKTSSKSESTQTERSLIIRTARSCPSHGKRVRFNFLMKINCRPKFQDLLFINRKSSDHLILEKGMASRSPAYVPIFQRFRWKYLTSRK